MDIAVLNQKFRKFAEINIFLTFSLIAGILNENQTINNKKSIERLSQVALAYAQAGKFPVF